MKIFQVLFLSLCLQACMSKSKDGAMMAQSQVSVPKPDLTNMEKAYFASGCFWCVEAVFESVLGVAEVVSGYAGGSAKDANYELVSAGSTDHAEAVEVYYDPKVVSFETLLQVFFDSHDPTTKDRQGPDAGRQYRSAIFYRNDAEKTQSEAYIKSLYDDGVFRPGTISTELAPFEAFYPAESYHQDFEKRNPNHPYIRNVSIPRLKRFESKRPELLKSESH